jgi:hypothetical protein
VADPVVVGYYLGGVSSDGPTVKQRITTLICCGLLALALVGVAAAGPLEDGQAAYQRGDFATALQIFRPLAEQGNAEAQRMLGAAASRPKPILPSFFGPGATPRGPGE